MGISLHCIPDVRHLYNKDALDTTPVDTTPVDFDTWKQKPPHGHVIAVRITLEDPNAGFEPTSGAIQEFNFHSTPDVWGYFSLDSQIGHLFSWSPTREKARKYTNLATKELSIRGDTHTTVEYITNLMKSDVFKFSRISTS